jgi:hypothetical protein
LVGFEGRFSFDQKLSGLGVCHPEKRFSLMFLYFCVQIWNVHTLQGELLINFVNKMTQQVLKSISRLISIEFF